MVFLPLMEWKVVDLLLEMELAVLLERRVLSKEFTGCDHIGNKSTSSAFHGPAADDVGNASKGAQHVSHNGGSTIFQGIDLSFCRPRWELYATFMA
jgi:hypothetical protein